MRHRLGFDHWTDDDVAAFVSSWAPRVRGWFVAMTSHDLIPAYEQALAACGRYVFAPVPWVSVGSRPRMAGDGPASWAVYLVVSRPRSKPYSNWGSLPGAYVTTRRGRNKTGGKPVDLMRAIVRDYSRPGDLIVDPTAGRASTLVAAKLEGRSAIGSEIDPDEFEIGRARLEEATTPDLFSGADTGPTKTASLFEM